MMLVRHFTLSQARALLPHARAAAARIHAIVLEARAMQDGAPPTEGRGLEALQEDLQKVLGEVQGWGAQIKGVDPVLVDFPALLHGRSVLLCWREGEDDIQHFHSEEDGFRGRRPVPEGETFGAEHLH